MNKSFIIFSLLLLCEINAHSQIKDFEGNIYDTVKIGFQTWLTSNIKSKFYSDGTPVALANFKCVNGDCNNTDTFGLHYNYTGLTRNESKRRIHGICPTGYNIPSPNEWHQLMLTLNADTTWLWKGAYNYVSDKIVSKQYGGSDISGLKIVPSGLSANGQFYNFQRGEFYKLIDSNDIKGVTIFFPPLPDGILRLEKFITDEIARSNDQYLPCRCIKNSITTSITELGSNESIKIFPNPSLNGEFTIEIGDELLGGSNEIQILSELGIVLFNETSLNNKIITFKLPRGVYIIKVIKSNNSRKSIYSKKVVLLNY